MSQDYTSQIMNQKERIHDLEDRLRIAEEQATFFEGMFRKLEERCKTQREQIVRLTRDRT